MKKELNKFVNSEKFNNLLKKIIIPKMLKMIDVSSLVTEIVNKYDTNELEQKANKLTGKYLGTIEILGGILGAFVGIAIFNVGLFGILFGLILVIVSIESLIKCRKYKKIKTN